MMIKCIYLPETRGYQVKMAMHVLDLPYDVWCSNLDIRETFHELFAMMSEAPVSRHYQCERTEVSGPLFYKLQVLLNGEEFFSVKRAQRISEGSVLA